MNGFRLRVLLLAALLSAGCGAISGPSGVDPGGGPGTPGGSPGTPGVPANPANPDKPDEIPPADARTLRNWPFEKFTRDKQNDQADPCNIAFVATEGQLREAARRAGWLGADPINPWTSLKMINAALRHKPYPTAPMSDLFLFGRKQDLPFQIPTDHVAVRDHFRLWETAVRDKQGRPLWIGAGTKDIAIKLEAGTNRTSHQIDPKIDDERQVIVESFKKTGLVALSYQVPGIGKRFEGVNGSGDPIWTDGMVAILELKAFPASEPKKK
jgi:hypothetical protein